MGAWFSSGTIPADLQREFEDKLIARDKARMLNEEEKKREIDEIYARKARSEDIRREEEVSRAEGENERMKNDDAAEYERLKNEFETRLQNMKEQIHTDEIREAVVNNEPIPNPLEEKEREQKEQLSERKHEIERTKIDGQTTRVNLNVAHDERYQRKCEENLQEYKQQCTSNDAEIRSREQSLNTFLREQSEIQKRDEIKITEQQKQDLANTYAQVEAFTIDQSTHSVADECQQKMELWKTFESNRQTEHKFLNETRLALRDNPHEFRESMKPKLDQMKESLLILSQTIPLSNMNGIRESEQNRLDDLGKELFQRINDLIRDYEKIEEKINRKENFDEVYFRTIESIEQIRLRMQEYTVNNGSLLRERLEYQQQAL